MTKITLEAWAAKEFAPAPSARTLRRWVADGKIVPAPVLIGRTYWCQPNAVHVAEAQATLGQRLRQAQAA